MATKTAAKLQISMSFRDAGYERGLKKARRDTRRTQSAVQKMTPSLGGLGKAAAAAGVAFASAFAVRGAFRAGKELAALGSIAEETASKYNTVFGPAVSGVNDFLDEFAIKAGQTREEMQAVVSTTGAIVQGFGATQTESARFAEEITRVAADLASFNNVKGGTQETSRALQAALAGEREQIKRYGIVLREEDVVARALLTTGKERASQLSTLEKAQASLTLITEKAGVAIGDLDRTQDSAANTARRLSARFRQIKEDIAVSLLPVFSDLLELVVDNEKQIKQLASAFVREVRAFTQQAQTILSAAGVDFGVTAGAIGQLIGARLGLGIARGFQGMVRTFTSPIKQFLASAGLPGTADFLLETLNPGLAALEIAARAATESIEDAEAALFALSNPKLADDLALTTDNLLRMARVQPFSLAAPVDPDAPLFGRGTSRESDDDPATVYTKEQLAEMRRQADVAANVRRHVADAERDFFERRFARADFSDIGGQAFRGETIAADLDLGQLPDFPDDSAFKVDERLQLLTPEQQRQFIDGVPLDELTGELKSFGDQTKELMFGVGEDLVTGLIQGTLDMGDILKRAMIGFASRFILGPLSGALGIFSPSKITRGFGMDLGRGLAIGMDSMQAAVGAASERMATAALPVMPRTPALAFAGDGPAAVTELRTESPPVEVNVNALFDPYRESQSAGGQAFHRSAARTARQQGFRD